MLALHFASISLEAVSCSYHLLLTFKYSLFDPAVRTIVGETNKDMFIKKSEKKEAKTEEARRRKMETEMMRYYERLRKMRRSRADIKNDHGKCEKR